MVGTHRVTVGRREMRFGCECGWEGAESDIEDWAVQTDRDRLVRVCPGCGEPAPEWGTFRPLDAVATVAKGPIRDALAASGVAGDR